MILPPKEFNAQVAVPRARTGTEVAASRQATGAARIGAGVVDVIGEFPRIMQNLATASMDYTPLGLAKTIWETVHATEGSKLATLVTGLGKNGALAPYLAAWLPHIATAAAGVASVALRRRQIWSSLGARPILMLGVLAYLPDVAHLAAIPITGLLAYLEQVAYVLARVPAAVIPIPRFPTWAGLAYYSALGPGVAAGHTSGRTRSVAIVTAVLAPAIIAGAALGIWANAPPQAVVMAVGDGQASAAGWPELTQMLVKVAPRRVGDPGRIATVALRAGPVTLKRPRNGFARTDPETVLMTLVEAREIDPPANEEPLRWRLLTTIEVADAAAACEIVRLYRLRWRIEEVFRALKSDGMRLEETQMHEAGRLFKLAVVGLAAACRTIQMGDARDGSPRPATDVIDTTLLPAAEAIGPTLEGKTERQKNRHPIHSLAWLSWIIARLGGWNCYYKPPGPKTMRAGWARFATMAAGFTIAEVLKAESNVRIP